MNVPEAAAGPSAAGPSAAGATPDGDAAPELAEGSIERVAADWLAAEEALARGSGNPAQSEVTARELSDRYDEAIRGAGREELRLAWEAARKWQAEQEMGSEAWAGARRLSDLLRSEYLALGPDPGDGAGPA